MLFFDDDYDYDDDDDEDDDEDEDEDEDDDDDDDDDDYDDDDDDDVAPFSSPRATRPLQVVLGQPLISTSLSRCLHSLFRFCFKWGPADLFKYAC